MLGTNIKINITCDTNHFQQEFRTVNCPFIIKLNQSNFQLYAINEFTHK
jgi:hypothetical protein